jgi:LPS export ABC transporter protein LptC
MFKVSYKNPLVIVALLLVLSVVVYRRDLPYGGGSLGPSLKPDMLLTMQNAYLVGSGAHGKLWSLKAKSVEMTQDRSNTTITKITDGRIFQQGKPFLHIDAGRAVYDQYSQDLRIENGILIRGDAGQVAKCKGAFWNPRNSLLTTVGRVSYHDASSRVTAEGLSVDAAKKEMTLTKPRMEVDLQELAGGAGIEQ